MISDAFVEVECDAPHCTEVLRVDLEAGVRHTYLYDERAVLRKIKEQGWSEKDGDHFCEFHTEEDDEPTMEDACGD